jgi:hypothetical protein
MNAADSWQVLKFNRKASESGEISCDRLFFGGAYQAKAVEMRDLYYTVVSHTSSFQVTDWLNTFACLTLVGFVGLMAVGRR